MNTKQLWTATLTFAPIMRDLSLDHRELGCPMLKYICIALLGTTATAHSQDSDGVLARCGASHGSGYFFYDENLSPAGPSWETDGISNGKIILVKLGDEWDIQFDDVAGAYSYRQDGAQVMPLMNKPGMLSVGAFGAQYADIYIFDLKNRTLAWSSNKIGPVPKVSVFSSDCE